MLIQISVYSKIAEPDKSDAELSAALESNLISAMRVASLLQPQEKTNFDQLVMSICNLSYLGDIRQKGFEDTKKVEKIVEGSYDYLKTLYLPIIDKCEWLESSGNDIYKVKLKQSFQLNKRLV